VAVAYVDTSAVGRVLLGEPDAAAILETLGAFDQHVSSRLLRIELMRLGRRENRRAEAESLLAAIGLVPLTDDLLARAETVDPDSVATLDALHLVTALALAADGTLGAVFTYDRRLAAGARHHGLTVVAPA